MYRLLNGLVGTAFLTLAPIALATRPINRSRLLGYTWLFLAGIIFAHLSLQKSWRTIEKKKFFAVVMLLAMTALSLYAIVDTIWLIKTHQINIAYLRLLINTTVVALSVMNGLVGHRQTKSTWRRISKQDLMDDDFEEGERLVPASSTVSVITEHPSEQSCSEHLFKGVTAAPPGWA